ncbi:MAG: hypothetical protein KGL37_07890 [Acidobacteriota bacterium]|nr:hypothetical protein [Acidobacteriota bacterium]
MRQHPRLMPLGPIVLMAGVTLLAGCGSGGGSNTTPPPPAPQIQNINSSTTPTSPVSLPIEINGSGFQSAPGKVTFVQGSISADVVPAASAWSDTGIVAAVPTGNGTTNFTTPGTVKVTVTTSGGTSNAVTVNLVATLNFTPSEMAWSTTMPLPQALTGLRAVGVPGSASTSAFAVVTGGYDGTANTTTAWAINLNQDGTVGSTTNTWKTIATNPLPTTLAHHSMAEADDTNSLVPMGKRFIYVLGGQVNWTDSAGSNKVYAASVDSTTGAVGTWTTLTSTLPQPLFGLTATVHNGYLYVAGGVSTGGAPVTAVYSAPVNADGTLGAWTTATNTLPTPRAFGTMFVFGGVIYYIDGDPDSSIPPNNQNAGDKLVYYASAIRGVVGTWTENGNQTIHDRAKGVLFTAYGQVIAGEGVYTGSVGSGEMETSTINASNTTNLALNSFNGLTGSSAQVPKANIYNAAGFTSPIVTSTNAPRFLLLGGQALSGTSGAGGALSSTVYYNNKP